jgi:hypothetical protein
VTKSTLTAAPISIPTKSTLTAAPISLLTKRMLTAVSKNRSDTMRKKTVEEESVFSDRPELKPRRGI